MLVIRDAQMEVLRQSLVDDFRWRALEHLKEIAGKKGLNLLDSFLESAIDRGIEQCQRFHLRREIDVVRYLEIVCFQLQSGEDADLPVEALQILLAYGVDPALKLDQFRAWAEHAVAVNAPSLIDG